MKLLQKVFPLSKITRKFLIKLPSRMKFTSNKMAPLSQSRTWATKELALSDSYCDSPEHSHWSPLTLLIDLSCFVRDNTINTLIDVTRTDLPAQLPVYCYTLITLTCVLCCLCQKILTCDVLICWRWHGNYAEINKMNITSFFGVAFPLLSFKLSPLVGMISAK